MDSKIDKVLLEKFFNKECTEKEELEVFLWLSNNHSSLEVERLLKDKWRQAKYLDSLDTNFDKIYLNVLSEINTYSSPFNHRKSAVSKYKNRNLVIYRNIAASVLILFSFVFAVSHFLQREQPIIEEITEVRKNTESGQKLSIQLPDGTLVTLNSESEIKYPQYFSDSTRIVFLSGEAFFKVAEDKKKPFIVKTEKVTTTALGTAFNVKADKIKEEVIVSLTEGKVMVSPREDDKKAISNYILNPGEEFIYNRISHEIEISKFEYNSSIGWKEGILIFNDADIDELKVKLEKWYGVTINLKNKPSKNWRFNSEYKDESLQNVLDGIKYTKDIEYTINNKNVEIFFK